LNKIRIGVIGVGKLGSFHCEKLANMDEAELVGVYDTIPDRATEIAKKYNTKSYSTIEALFNVVDAVSVAVPTSDHLKICKPALEHKLPVFVEKPITATVDQAKELVEISRANNTILQVGHVERFNPGLQALSAYNLKPMFIESHRLAPFDPRGSDVAVVLDLMIHDIDIIMVLVKSPVIQIEANGVAVVSDEADIANARVQFQNGCVANLTASRISQRKMRKMRLFQRDSYISIDFLQRLTEIFQIKDPGIHETLESTVILGQIEKGKKPKHIIYDRPKTPEIDALKEELRSFAIAVRDGSKPVVSGADGLRALEVATEISRIVKSQQTLH